MNAIVDEALVDADALMRAHGATTNELEDHLARYRAEMNEWKETSLAYFLGQLSRDGATLQWRALPPLASPRRFGPRDRAGPAHPFDEG